MVTLKNVLGIVGLVVISLFWVVITGTVLGGLFVLVLVVVVVLVLRREVSRKKPNPAPQPTAAV